MREIVTCAWFFVCVEGNMLMKRSRFGHELVHVVMLWIMLCLLIGHRISGHVICEQNVDTRVIGYFY